MRFLALAAFLLLPRLATAETAQATMPKVHSGHALLGFKAAVGGQQVDDNNHYGGGVAIFYETTVLDGAFDVEVVGFAAEVEEEVFFPIDLLAKTSWKMDRVNPYVGVGGSVTLERKDGAVRALPGIAATTGAYLWLTSWVALDVEVDYNHILGIDKGPVHELSFAVGPALRM